MLQPLADGVKFFFKEEMIPDGANPLIFRLAPIMAAVPAMLTVAVIPFAGDVDLFGVDWGPLSIADLDIGSGSRRRCGVYRSHHRGSDFKAVFLRLNRHDGFNWCCYRSRNRGDDGRRCRNSYRCDRCSWRIAADAHRFLALGDFDLGYAGFVQ